jgi:predicted dehydrogenase
MAQNKFNCRWALLSLSTICRETFVPDLILPRDASDPITHEVVCLSTTGSKERAQEWLKQYNVPNRENVVIYNSWEEMLKKGDFDIVYISTPHPLHYEETMLALQNKRHVLLEKPATMNAEQYRRLIQAAKENGVVLMEAMWTRYLPAAQYLVKELLPRIGKIKRVFADFSFPIVSPDLEESSRFLDKQAGAGALLDQGVYALTWADMALNSQAPSDAKVIHANSIGIPTSKGEVDDMNTVIISRNGTQGADSAVAIVTTSMTLTGASNKPFYDRLQAKKPAPCVRIEASDAQVSVPFPPIRPEEFHVQWYAPQYTDEKGVEKEEVIQKPVERGWGIWYQADVIAKRVFERRQAPQAEGEVIAAEESLRVLEWMDDARKLAGIKYDPELDRV